MDVTIKVRVKVDIFRRMSRPLVGAINIEFVGKQLCRVCVIPIAKEGPQIHWGAGAGDASYSGCDC